MEQNENIKMKKIDLGKITILINYNKEIKEKIHKAIIIDAVENNKFFVGINPMEHEEKDYYATRIFQGIVIFIHEPETRLHPKEQYDLCKLFVDSVKTHPEKKIILSTNSEHILFGLLNAVEKQNISENDLYIYTFHNNKQERLNVNKHGQVKGGLPIFFEVEVQELLDALGEQE